MPLHRRPTVWFLASVILCQAAGGCQTIPDESLPSISGATDELRHPPYPPSAHKAIEAYRRRQQGIAEAKERADEREQPELPQSPDTARALPAAASLFGFSLHYWPPSTDINNVLHVGMTYEEVVAALDKWELQAIFLESIYVGKSSRFPRKSVSLNIPRESPGAPRLLRSWHLLDDTHRPAKSRMTKLSPGGEASPSLRRGAPPGSEIPTE